MGATAFAGADRSDPPRSMAEAAALEAALRTGRHHRHHGAGVKAEWRISLRQRYRRLLRVDAGASVALIRFRLDRGAGVRLAAAVERLHDDAIRTQGRARRPPRRVFAVSQTVLKPPLKTSSWPGIRLTHRPRLADIGRFPDHALAALAAEQLDRIAVVDVPELSLVNAVAAELLQPARKTPRGFLRNAELQVFLLPHPAPAIGTGERKAPAVAGIGAAAMPERAVEQHHAAGRHRRGDGVIFPVVFRRAVVFVATRQNPGRAVVIPKVRQRPDRIEGDRDVRTRQRNQLGVLMYRLRLLARAEHQ